MRIPLTPMGFPQVVAYPVVLGGAMVVLAWAGRAALGPWGLGVTEALLGLALGWMLSFFRDPERVVPQDPDALVAPADGRVTDIETLPGYDGYEGPVLRIGIFLSVFNVHINRAPCAVRVQTVTHREGHYRNALSAESAQVNESNTVRFQQTTRPGDPVWVKQISGAIARRIVCHLSPEQQLDRGARFGMIKFGSRTELYVPQRDTLQCDVKVGARVRAGHTILARYHG